MLRADARLSQRGLSPEELWRLYYRIRPYLTGASLEELDQRLADILRNIYTLTPAGKIGVLSPDDGALLWLQKLSDLRQEYFRRNDELEVRIRPEYLPFNQAALELVRANHRLQHHPARRPVFCRYGRLQWMRALLECGQLLLSPASYYKAIEHGLARRDDELVVKVFISPYDYELGLVHESITCLAPQPSLGTVSVHKPSDHYLYSVTVRFDFRHFIDFGEDGEPAEACVLIHNQEEFERRLRDAVHQALPDWWDVSFDAAKYVDPYFVLQGISGAEIYSVKDIRFIYQGEYRLMAIPPLGNKDPLSRLPLELGPLSDIAELIIVETSSPAV